MKRSVCLLAAGLLITANALAQGPDVIVGQLTGPNNYGVSGGVAAYSVGTTSCNVGTTPLNWFANPSPNHPVIAQNMWRYHEGRFEMIGMSWLKHGFAALNGSLCDPCQNTGGTTLGVGCSDPYGAGLNGSQSNLGARSDINATLGTNPGFVSNATGNVIFKRLQVQTSDLLSNPGQTFAGARYFMEGHYIAADDSAAGNDDNNSSYREVSVNPGGSYDTSYIGATRREKQGLLAWQECDPNVSIEHIDIPGDGRVSIGMSRTDLGGDTYHLEYVVHNLNSHRSVRSFAVDLPAGATTSGVYFRDCDYHSGEPYTNADWTVSSTAFGFTWSGQTFSQNQNASALRWGTASTFSLDVTLANPPEDLGRTASIELFRPPIGEWHTTTFCPAPPVIPPTGGGYTVDTNAAYDFVNIGAGNPGPTGDDSGLNVPLGFGFNYYGTNYTELTLSSNGYLCFDGNAGDFSNDPIPGASNPGGIIAPYWDDLNPSAGGSGPIKWDTVGTAPNRRFVAWWDGVEHFGNNDTEDVQCILDENGTITFSYVATTQGGSSATIGIQNPGDSSEGIQVAYQQSGSVVGSSSITFTPTGITIPASAELNITGDGSAFSIFHVDVLSTPNSPIILFVDVAPGPTDFGAFGTIPLSFTSAFGVACDGPGLFSGAPNFGCFTDECGVWSFEQSIGPLAVPSASPLAYFAVLVSDPNAPNGFFHISNGAFWPVP